MIFITGRLLAHGCHGQSAEHPLTRTVAAMRAPIIKTMTQLQSGSPSAVAGLLCPGSSVLGRVHIATASTAPEGVVLERVSGCVDGAPKALMDRCKTGRRLRKHWAPSQLDWGSNQKMVPGPAN